MNKKWYGIILILMIGPFLAANIFLPSALSQLGDDQYFGNIQTEAAEETNMAVKRQMPIPAKIGMLESRKGDTSIVSLTQGAVLDEASVQEACIRELNKLKELGLLPPEIVVENGIFGLQQSSFYISTSEPANTMIVWYLQLYTGKNVFQCYLDDESGKILRLSCNLQKQMKTEDLTIVAGKWASYLRVNLSGTRPDEYTLAIKEKFDSSVKNADQNLEVVTQSMEGDSILATFEADGQLVDCRISLFEGGYQFGGGALSSLQFSISQ